jgi:hypothetical protein
MSQQAVGLILKLTEGCQPPNPGWLLLRKIYHHEVEKTVSIL